MRGVSERDQHALLSGREEDGFLTGLGLHSSTDLLCDGKSV